MRPSAVWVVCLLVRGAAPQQGEPQCSLQQHHSKAEMIVVYMQATRVKFVFEKDALEVVIGEKDEKSENAFVGGENRWQYKAFTNWEFW